MAEVIQFEQGTAVDVADRDEAQTVADAVLAAEDSEDSDIVFARVTTTSNDAGGYTVAVNTHYKYDDTRAAATQKADFEAELRALDPLIDTGLEGGAAGRMKIIEA